MQHKVMLGLAEQAIRGRICPQCYQRPANSELLGPTVKRSCEPTCTIFAGLPKLLGASAAGRIDAVPDDTMKQFVCPTCNISPTAGDYCSEGMTRVCPLSRYGGIVLEILEDLQHRHAPHGTGPAHPPPNAPAR